MSKEKFEYEKEAINLTIHLIDQIKSLKAENAELNEDIQELRKSLVSLRRDCVEKNDLIHHQNIIIESLKAENAKLKTESKAVAIEAESKPAKFKGFTPNDWEVITKFISDHFEKCERLEKQFKI